MAQLITKHMKTTSITSWGYPINLSSADVCTEHVKEQEVIDMPEFPDPECVKMIEDVLVVKLSETLSMS